MRVLAGMFIKVSFPLVVGNGYFVVTRDFGDESLDSTVSNYVFAISSLILIRTLIGPRINSIRHILAGSLSMATAVYSVFAILFIYLVNPSPNYWCPNANMLIVPFVKMRSL